MKKAKIVVIGSGSQFTEFFLQELFKFEEFKGCTLALVDRKPDRLQHEVELANRISKALDWGVTVEGHTKRNDALPQADYVYCFLAVNSKEAWKKEFELCNKHGINPYEAYTVGAPGLNFSIRHVPVMLDIAADIERLCPDAWLILDNNPLSRILAALDRHSKVKWIGYCNGHEMIQMALEQLLGKDERTHLRDADPIEREFMVPSGTVDILLAGINHLQWVTDVRDSATGEDLYPLVMETIRKMKAKEFPGGYRFIFEAAKLLGFVCSPADNHVGDYLWFVDDTIADRCGLKPYPVDQWFGGRMADDWAEIVARYHSREAIKTYVSQRRIGWLSLQIARYLMTAGQKYHPALNLMNNGAISNLTDDIIVELPAVVGPDGPKAVQYGPLPEVVAPYCQLVGSITNIVADAAATGSRELALQALLLDPFIHSATVAEALLEDMLAYSRQYETRFE
jgi:alpha-galactosidase